MADVVLRQEPGGEAGVPDVGVDFLVDAAERGAELGVEAAQRGVGAACLVEQQAPPGLVEGGPLEGVDLVDDEHVAAAEHEFLDGDPVGDAVAVVHGDLQPAGEQVGVRGDDDARRARGPREAELAAGHAPGAGDGAGALAPGGVRWPQGGAGLLPGLPGVDLCVGGRGGGQRAPVAEPGPDPVGDRGRAGSSGSRLVSATVSTERGDISGVTATSLPSRARDRSIW